MSADWEDYAAVARRRERETPVNVRCDDENSLSIGPNVWADWPEIPAHEPGDMLIVSNDPEFSARDFENALLQARLIAREDELRRWSSDRRAVESITDTLSPPFTRRLDRAICWLLVMPYEPLSWRKRLLVLSFPASWILSGAWLLWWG